MIISLLYFGINKKHVEPSTMHTPQSPFTDATKISAGHRILHLYIALLFFGLNLIIPSHTALFAQEVSSEAPMSDQIQARIQRVAGDFEKKGYDLAPLLADSRFVYIEGITQKFTRSAERRIESFEDYKEVLAYEIKKNKLAEFYSTYSAELQAAEEEFDIPKEIIMGILGVESEFGTYKGNYNPFNAYISMMAEDYRYSFAEAQLEELLKFCKRTGLDIMSLQSSYAGAMSYAQFIPYSLNRWWKNSEGQGLYHMPDNIRSVANYLAHFTKIEGNVEGAILRYNTSSLYQQAVLSLAEDAKQVIP